MDLEGKYVICLQDHEDSIFTVGYKYRVVSHQVVGVRERIRIRDDRRNRRDFNTKTHSKNYIWKYFKLVGES